MYATFLIGIYLFSLWIAYILGKYHSSIEEKNRLRKRIEFATTTSDIERISKQLGKRDKELAWLAMNKFHLILTQEGERPKDEEKRRMSTLEKLSKVFHEDD